MKTDMDVYKSFYTKSDPITEFMMSQLQLFDGAQVAEPCAGDGVFVDRIVDAKEQVDLDLFELDPKAIRILKDKYGKNENISIQETDFLLDENIDFRAGFGQGYDRIIGNPPYGGWQSPEKRLQLKSKYRGLYVKETYTLFLYQCIRLLRPNGKLVFVIPDTFLNLHMHTGFREFLLKECCIDTLAIFPSKFFPNVKYGYSQMCIIALTKQSDSADPLSNNITVITEIESPEFLNSVKGNVVETIPQKQVYSSIDHALLRSGNKKVDRLINEHDLRLGEIASCVTGFYSGDDKKFIQPRCVEVRGARRYSVVNPEEIRHDYLAEKDLIDGIGGSRNFIPIVKGGKRHYRKPNDWYIDWSIDAVETYKSNPKARFQNSGFYFNEGIGVPMVSSTSISGVLLEKRLFDQSIVGVFPKKTKYLSYLLAFFNSSSCHRLIRTINPSANNSANYLKKLPIILPDASTLRNINVLMKRILEGEGTETKIAKSIELDAFFKRIYGF